MKIFVLKGCLKSTFIIWESSKYNKAEKIPGSAMNPEMTEMNV
jgi:hypothetical protein